VTRTTIARTRHHLPKSQLRPVWIVLKDLLERKKGLFEEGNQKEEWTQTLDLPGIQKIKNRNLNMSPKVQSAGDNLLNGPPSLARRIIRRRRQCSQGNFSKSGEFLEVGME